MKKYYCLYIIGLVLLGTACKKDQYYLYNDTARIQFGPEPGRIYTTSFNFVDTVKRFTFFYDDPAVTQDTVFFDIYAIGGTADKDREFKLQQEQIAGVENAVAGVHYKDFNSSELSTVYTIKAGAVHTRVPVIFLRAADLKTKTVELKFTVISNNNFAQGEKSLLWRKAIVTDRLSQPSSWDAWYTQYRLGKYSTVKHAFMIEKTGQKWDAEFLTYLMTTLAEMGYWVSECKTALINYNNANPGNQLKDEFGEFVQFP
jgi:hypothetical protein